MTERPTGNRFVPHWTWLFLAGPVIWYLYFWVVYLVAEAGCAADAQVLVTWVTLGLTGVTLLAITYHALRSARESTETENDDIRSLVRAGLLMGGFFLVASLFVGVPALVLQPC